MKRVYLIGFDLCGGLALHRYFIANGYDATFDDEDGFSSVAMENFQQGQPLLKGFENCSFFSQIQHETADGAYVYTNELLLEEFYKQEPSALYVFNYQPLDNWLESRQRFYGYLPKVMKREQLDEQQVLALWRQAYVNHKTRVLELLAGKTNFFMYDYAEHNFSELNSFFKSHGIAVDESKYQPVAEIRGSIEQRFHIQNIREAALYFRYHRFDIDTAINLLAEAERHQPCRYYFKDELKKWKLEKATWTKE
ncbi:hypothetical protein SG34_001870 [Thalassomonas viridans]|uniref:Uncharacterized protein n=1 Tax=Thalassomonas viridans TaxID=137584 RepID=A0AAE9Z3N7_9GAMM|nr:hypothetical protein [Thalassomonas viridans]WDE05707.1 hypothetical protein SG34_001870 [Thalassomonas viridans]